MILTFPNIHGSGELYMDVMRVLCGDTSDKSMADLCSNKAPYTSQLGFKERAYFDILPRVLDNPNEQKYFVQKDVLLLDPFSTYYDFSFALDAIEHFTKEKGLQLIYLMGLISRKQILFTPLGEYMVDRESTDPEGHHSGWWPEDFPNYAKIVFPDYHPTLGVGAFFFWKCDDLEADFERVERELTQKSKTWK